MQIDLEPFVWELARLFRLPTVWELFFGAIIPIAAISIATFFVLQQLRQAESHRAADRKAEAAAELTDLLVASADLVVAIVTEAGKSADQRIEITTMDKYRLNKHYIRACAYLDGDDLLVAEWAQDRAHKLFTIPRELVSQGVPLPVPGEPHGQIRTAVTDASTSALRTLVRWSSGQLDPAWFRTQYEVHPNSASR